MQYSTGTLTLTNGSAAVTGTGTAWVGGLRAGWILLIPGEGPLLIQSVASDTALTLARPYQGSTRSGAVYNALATRGEMTTFLTQLQTVLTAMQGTIDGAGAGKFADGTVAIPGLRFTSDEDTGMRRTAANALALVTGGADRLAVNNAGAVLTGLLTGTAVTQSDTDVTAGRLLRTVAGPAQAFRRGNILGTVAQASGVPTGAVIERGSNANGEYVRFADGTQICRTVAQTIDVATATGSVFRGLGSAVSWPAAFSAVPFVAHVPTDSANLWGGNQLSSTAANAVLRLMSPTSVTGVQGWSLGIGRWF